MPRRALNNDTGTPKWPGDHAAKHRAAALKGWARKKGFTRDTVSRPRRKAAETAPAPTQGIALGRAARTERPHPSAEYGYTSHTLPVARLTLMHELGREQDAAKRTAIRRELRKLGVPSDQIPKEPRAPKPEPRQKREHPELFPRFSNDTRKPSAERKPRVSYEQWKQQMRELENLKPVRHIPEREIDLAAPLDAYFLNEVYGHHQLRQALTPYSPSRLREAVAEVKRRNPGTKPRAQSHDALIAYILEYVK